MENWEIVKEDIIPCRRGRDVTTVVEAVSRQNDPVYHRERLSKINYMDWLNDSYAYVGNTKYLESILVRAIREVSKVDSIKDDHRYINWWLELIKFCQNSIPVFRLLFDNGIGTMNSYFFISWADAYLEEAMLPNISPIKVLSHWKQVSLLLAHAIRAGSEPKPPIHHRAKSFQVSYQKYFEMLKEKHPENYNKAITYLVKNPTDSLFVNALSESKNPGLITHDKFGLPDVQKNFSLHKQPIEQRKQKNMKMAIFQDPTGESAKSTEKPKSDLTKIHLLKSKPSAQTKEDKQVIEKIIEPCLGDKPSTELGPLDKKEKKQAFLIYQDEQNIITPTKSSGDRDESEMKLRETQKDVKKGISSDDMIKFIENINNLQPSISFDQEFSSTSSFHKINFPSIPFPWNEEYPETTPYTSLKLIYGGLCEKTFEEFRISHYKVERHRKVLAQISLNNNSASEAKGAFKTTYKPEKETNRRRLISLSEYTSLDQNEVNNLALSLENFARGRL